MDERKNPRAGEVWRHFKGNKYRIITIARQTETNELLVIYYRIGSKNKNFARPLDMFMSLTDKDKYPDAGQKYRFELVKGAFN